jgi:N-methylhydantoinase B
VIRELELRAPAEITLVADRRRRPPYGLAGGGPGTVGHDTLLRAGKQIPLPSKITFSALPGDRITLATPGGGGHSDPHRAAFWSQVSGTEPD